MPSKLFDIGANLTHESFEKDLKEVLERAINNDINNICITGCNLLDSKKALEIAQLFPDNLITTCGIHPHYADSFDQSSILKLKDFTKNESVKAIGETGLDFNRNFSSPEDQQKSFEAHLELSIELSKPLFLHERDAHEKFVEITSPYLKDLPKSVVHCFTGTEEALLKYLDMGFYIGITGWLCDERRGKHLEKLISLIPLEKLMIETDAPYLLPRDMGIDNSSRNEPKYLNHIARKVAEFRKESEELVFTAIYMNSLDFFDMSV